MEVRSQQPCRDHNNSAVPRSHRRLQKVNAMDSTLQTPRASNEPILSYSKGSSERSAIELELKRQAGTAIDIPLLIGASEYRTSRTVNVTAPDEHALVLGKVHQAEEAHVQLAISAANSAAADWGCRS